MIATEARNAELIDLAAILRQQHARKLDVVLPATSLFSRDGVLRIDTDEVVMDDTGVTPVRGAYRPTRICDEGISSTLGVPLAFLRRLRTERPDLLDTTVNGLLHGRQVRRAGGAVETVYPADDRSFLLRCYRGDDGGEGVARALLSSKFRMIDNIDVLTAGLEGVRASGLETEVVRCDLSERTMRVTLAAPGLRAMAPTLLHGYRSPFDQGAERAGSNGDVGFWRGIAEREGLGYEPGTEPVLFAGLTIANSETGDGAFSITPELLVRVCRNGLTLNAFAQRQVHLGGRLDDGLVRWSDETQQANLELIKGKARDTIQAMLTQDFLNARVGEIEARAGAPITSPEKQIKVIGKRLGFSEDRTESVLAHFIMGGSLTAGGVLNAITSVAQTIADPDEAADVQSKGIAALELAHSLAI